MPLPDVINVEYSMQFDNATRITTNFDITDSDGDN